MCSIMNSDADIFSQGQKNICVFPIAWSSKLESVGRDFFVLFVTYTYAPSSKITQTCLFLSYYSLSIIWHAVQCFWFQTSIKCTRKWRKLLKSETNMETETNFQILRIYFFYFGIKNVRVSRLETHFCLFGLKYKKLNKQKLVMHSQNIHGSEPEDKVIIIFWA